MERSSGFDGVKMIKVFIPAKNCKSGSGSIPILFPADYADKRRFNFLSANICDICGRFFKLSHYRKSVSLKSLFLFHQIKLVVFHQVHHGCDFNFWITQPQTFGFA